MNISEFGDENVGFKLLLYSVNKPNCSDGYSVYITL